MVPRGLCRPFRRQKSPISRPMSFTNTSSRSLNIRNGNDLWCNLFYHAGRRFADEIESQPKTVIGDGTGVGVYFIWPMSGLNLEVRFYHCINLTLVLKLSFSRGSIRARSTFIPVKSVWVSNSQPQMNVLAFTMVATSLAPLKLALKR